MEELPHLHIQRPYGSLDEYLEGDFWTVERKDMFLIGAPPFDPGVAVKFTIELADGTSVVTGEGRVVEHTVGSDDFPGGLKVRFRQLDADAKAVLRRCLELRRAYAAAMEAQAAAEQAAAAEGAAESPANAPAPPAAEAPAEAPPRVDAAPAPAAVPDPLRAPAAPLPVATAISATTTLAAFPPPPANPPIAASPASREPVHLSRAAPPPKPRSVAPRPRARVVAAPPNRDALLGRLRERARRFRSASGAARSA